MSSVKLSTWASCWDGCCPIWTRIYSSCTSLNQAVSSVCVKWIENWPYFTHRVVGWPWTLKTYTANILVKNGVFAYLPNLLSLLQENTCQIQKDFTLIAIRDWKKVNLNFAWQTWVDYRASTVWNAMPTKLTLHVCPTTCSPPPLCMAALLSLCMMKLPSPLVYKTQRKNRVVEEPSHGKQLSLIYVCKIGLNSSAWGWGGKA
jgi:hypothetical protein